MTRTSRITASSGSGGERVVPHDEDGGVVLVPGALRRAQDRVGQLVRVVADP